jgi:hypothetical protein
MPRLFVIPMTAARTRATIAPAAMQSNLVSVNISLRHPAQLFAEIGDDKMSTSLRITFAFSIEH